MEGRSAQEVSLSTRLQVWIQGIPLYTRGFFIVVVGLYALQLLSGWPSTGSVCLSATAVVRSWQVHRVFTAVLYHIGILHVAFNMLAFVPIGQDVERLMGTLQFAYLNFLLIVLEALLYSSATFLLQLGHVLKEPQCAVGASGVIFGLIVVDNSLSVASHRSILGLFTVPALYYPWALLVFWQLLMPDISFIGHLSGILVGEAYSRGWLDWLKLSSSSITKLESTWPISTYMVPYSGFIMRPGMSLPVSHPGSYQVTPQSRSSAPRRSLVSFSQLVQWAQSTRGDTNRSAAEDPERGSAEAAAAGGSTFQGAAYHLGGFDAAQPQSSNPRAAAAAAAEARLGVAGPGGPGAPSRGAEGMIK